MIETRRLSIRSFREEDWQAVHAYSTDPELARYVPGDPPTEKDTLEAIRAWIHGRTADPPHFDFAVTVSPDDFVIGWCCIQISASDRRLGELMYVAGFSVNDNSLTIKNTPRTILFVDGVFHRSDCIGGIGLSQLFSAQADSGVICRAEALSLRRTLTFCWDRVAFACAPCRCLTLATRCYMLDAMNV